VKMLIVAFLFVLGGVKNSADAYMNKQKIKKILAFKNIQPLILVQKYRYQVCAIGTALVLIFVEKVIPNFKFGLFQSTRTGLTCLLNIPLVTLVTTLLTIVDTTISVSLLVYLIAIAIKIAEETGNARDPAPLHIEPILVFLATLILFIAQNIFFATFKGACS
jgi:hypothetical protein